MIKEYQEFKQQHGKLLETLTDHEKKQLEVFEQSLLDSLQKLADLLSRQTPKPEGQ